MRKTLTIPGSLPGLNEIVAASKKHYGQYSQMKRQYTELVFFHAQSLPTFKKIDAEITWYCKDKKRDKDNISGGGTKFILDGLVKAEVIKNDTWEYVGDVSHRFAVDKINPRVEIELTEVGE